MIVPDSLLMWKEFELVCGINPKSDQHLISPYNITPESHIKVMLIWSVFMLPLKVTPWIALCTFPLRYFTLHLTVHFWSQKKTGSKAQHCEISGKERWVKRDPEAKDWWKLNFVGKNALNSFSSYVSCYFSKYSWLPLLLTPKEGDLVSLVQEK